MKCCVLQCICVPQGDFGATTEAGQAVRESTSTHEPADFDRVAQVGSSVAGFVLESGGAQSGGEKPSACVT